MRQKLTTIQYIEAAERYAKGDISLRVMANELGVSDSTLHRKFFGPGLWYERYKSLLPDDIDVVARKNQSESNAKINRKTADKIRVLNRAGYSYKEIAGKLDISQRQVNGICLGQVWQ